MTATYSAFSPYYKTPITNGYLETTTVRSFTSYPDDALYQVSSKYENRPDLLAHDLYGDSRLWWVFSVRNPSIIKDSIYDLVSGVSIYIPKLATLKKDLGI